MDALAAIGLAAGVLQFVDFAGKVVSKSIELHKSSKDGIDENTTIEAATTRLTELSKTIQAAETGSSNQISLWNIAQECLNDGQELTQTLAKLRPKDDGKRSLAAAALKTVWKQGKLEQLLSRLHNYRIEMCTHLLSDNKQDLIKIACAMNDVKSATEGISQAITNQHRTLSSAISTLQAAHDQNEAEVIQQIKATETILHIAFRKATADVLNSVFHKLEQSTSKLADKNDISQLALMLNETMLENSREHRLTQQMMLDSQYLRNRSIDPQHEAQLQQRLLNDLEWHGLFHREMQVEVASSGTFEWMFNGLQEPQDSKTKHTGFKEWLKSHQDLFWVTGKPGSGKSTLIKSIAKDSRTKGALTEWAGSSDFMIVSAYFWIAGLPIQRSFAGLLRSLIFQILKVHRDLIPELFPDEWHKYQVPGFQQEDWHEEELVHAIKLLAMPKYSSRLFCMFLDGLDEYQIDPQRASRNYIWLSKFFAELSTAPHIKVCVSSRPWPEFEQIFSHFPGINVHEWTYQDMELFVKQEIEQHPYWPEIAIMDQHKTASLINEISEYSEGVFLWVVLVVRNVVDDLMNGSTIEELKNSIRKLPRDLQGYYQRILEQMDQRNRARVTKAVVLCLQSGSVWLYNYHYLDEDDLTFGYRTKIEAMSLKEFKARSKNLQRFLKGRCRDIFAFDLWKKKDRFWQPIRRDIKDSDINDDDVHTSMGTSVRFMHRTFKDYLETTEASNFLDRNSLAWLDHEDWSYQSILAEVKKLSNQSLGSIFLPVLNLFALRFVSHCTRFEKADVILLESIDEAIQLKVRTYTSENRHWSHLFIKSLMCCEGIEVVTGFEDFLQLAVYMGLFPYVKAKILDPDPKVSPKRLEKLCDIAFGVVDASSNQQYCWSWTVLPVKQILKTLEQCSKILYDRGLHPCLLTIHEDKDIDSDWRLYRRDASGRDTLLRTYCLRSWNPWPKNEEEVKERIEKDLERYGVDENSPIDHKEDILQGDSKAKKIESGKDQLPAARDDDG